MRYIGIDLGGTKIAAGLTDENGHLIMKDSVPTRKEREYPEIIADMAALCERLIERDGIKTTDVKSIGIGCPGTPDTKNGVIVYANNIRFRNVPVAAEMRRHLDIPVIVDNDGNCAALAESVAGAAKDAAHSITITLGTGIGGGFIIDNKIYSGFNFAAPEVGHMAIIVDGEQCSCGRRGCWEAYASATALINQTITAARWDSNSLINELTGGDLNRIDAKTAFDAARKGDEAGIRVVGQYIVYLAEGITNLINLFSPEVFAIGGGVSNEGEYLLKPLREHVKKGVYSREEIPQTFITAASMGNDAGIVGAAMLGL